MHALTHTHTRYFAGAASSGAARAIKAAATAAVAASGQSGAAAEPVAAAARASYTAENFPHLLSPQQRRFLAETAAAALLHELSAAYCTLGVGLLHYQPSTREWAKPTARYSMFQPLVTIMCHMTVAAEKLFIQEFFIPRLQQREKELQLKAAVPRGGGGRK